MSARVLAVRGSRALEPGQFRAPFAGNELFHDSSACVDCRLIHRKHRQGCGEPLSEQIRHSLIELPTLLRGPKLNLLEQILRQIESCRHAKSVLPECAPQVI